MKVVVIGDVSRAGQYHVGDEAMTEVAIAQLKRHGADVTLVAGDPDLSAEFYGVRTVPRLGFLTVPTPRKKKMLATLTSALSGEAAHPKGMQPAIEAVAGADAVVIAGGGNLNSLGEHAIFERLALARMAASFDVPLFVSSQTVGPELSREEREMVKEIAAVATVFGVRERSSAQLMRDLSADPDKIVLTYDDAVLLPQLETSGVPEVEFSLPPSFVVGSFTDRPGTIEMSAGDFQREVASALDRIVATCDVDIVLVPHIGVLGARDETDRDCMAHARIADLMTSARVHQLPVVSAAQTAAVTSQAEFTLSTRYHPVVFGPSVGVPAIGLVTSHYAMVRMRGAAEHVGMSACVVPFEGWNDLFGPRVVRGLVRDRDEITRHLDDVAAESVRFQTAWWDGIAASIRGTGDVVRTDVPALRSYEWGTSTDRESLAVFTAAYDSLNRTRDRLSLQAREHAREVKDLRRQLTKLTDEREQLRRDHAVAVEKASTSQRALQRQIDEIRSRQRPPGAAIRDGVRRRLRRRRRRG